MEEKIKDLSLKLRQYRKMHSYTQAHVAESIGIETKYYNSVENGHRSLDISKLIKLCRLYKITLDDLISLSDDIDKSELKQQWIKEINEELIKMDAEDVGRIKSTIKFWND